MIDNYTRAEALGDDSLTELDFDFLITKKADILVTILEDGEDPIIVDGNDTDYVSDVEFDPVNGAGTVTLVNPLATGQTLYLDLNVVEPVQHNLFRDRGGYSLRDFEKALDYVVTGLITLFQNMTRSVRFARHIDPADFDTTLPDDLVGSASVVPVTNTTGTGWAVGPTVSEISNAQTYATAASASATAAAASAALLARSVTGTRAAPQAIVAGTGIAFTGTSWFNTWYVEGSGGAVNISANPQIAAGTNVGQELELVGRSNANTVTLEHGDGLDLNGTCVLGESSVLLLRWDGTNWYEVSRR